MGDMTHTYGGGLASYTCDMSHAPLSRDFAWPFICVRGRVHTGDVTHTHVTCLTRTCNTTKSICDGTLCVCEMTCSYEDDVFI